MRRDHLLEICLEALRAEASHEFPGFCAALADDGVDWPQFIQFTSAHLMTCSIYHSLNVGGVGDQLPQEVHLFLEDLFQLNATRNGAISRQLVEIVSLLEAEGVPVVLLKSAAGLATQLYRHPGERVILDIDLLVPAAGLSLAVEALRHAGYEDPHDSEPYASRVYHHTPLIHEAWPAAVELHFHPMEPKYAALLSAEDLLRESRGAQLAGTAVQVPSPEHRVIHCVTHAQLHHHHHLLRRIPWRDLWEFTLLRRQLDPELNWPKLQGQFSRAGYSRVLPAVLEAADRYFHQALPSGCFTSKCVRYALEPQRTWPTVPFRLGSGALEKLLRNARSFHNLPAKLVSRRAWSGYWEDLGKLRQQQRHK